jgi:hypothetical protein
MQSGQLYFIKCLNYAKKLKSITLKIITITIVQTPSNLNLVPS